MKIVIDTNLLVACMFNPESASSKIIKMASDDLIDIMWDENIRHEAEFILNKIKRAARTGNKFNFELPMVFKPRNRVRDVPEFSGVSEDPDDDKFLACAVFAMADMIVSNDKHLLKLVEFRGTPIYGSRRALEIIKREAQKPLDS